MFVAVRPKGMEASAPAHIIPLEFDIDGFGLAGINLKNDPNFKRIDVGLPDVCYHSEANYMEIEDCLSAEYLWSEGGFDDAVTLVYRFPDGTTQVLFSEGEYGELPGDADARLEDSEEKQGQELILHPFGLPSSVEVPVLPKPRRPRKTWETWERWDDELYDKFEAQLTLGGSFVPYMAPVYWMTRGQSQEAETDDGPVVVQTWTNIGLGYYAIPIEALVLLVDHFESVFGIKTGKRLRVVATPVG